MLRSYFQPILEQTFPNSLAIFPTSNFVINNFLPFGFPIRIICLCHSSSMKVIFLLGKSIPSSLLWPYFSQFHDFDLSTNCLSPFPHSRTYVFISLFSFWISLVSYSCLIRKCVFKRAQFANS